MAHINPIQLQKFLKGVDYPADKNELLECARSHGADENVLTTLENLQDESFQTPADVSEAVGRLGDGDQQRGGGGQAPRQDAKRDEKHEARPEAKRDQKHEARADAKRDQKEEARPAAQHDQKPERGHGATARHPHYTGSNEFLIEAMQNTMAEIQICEIALEKSANRDVRDFSQKMIDEHGQMGRDMENLATQKKLNAPREIRPEQEMTVDELSSLDGQNFEQRWIQYNIDVHERDIKVFTHYADEEQDPEIRKMAENGVKRLKQHLKLAHEVGKKLAKG